MTGGEQTLASLAQAVGGKLRGEARCLITGVATLSAAGPRDLSFLASPRYLDQAKATAAGGVLISRGVDLPGRNLIEVEDAHLALAIALEILHPAMAATPGVSPRAIVGPGCDIAESSTIFAGAVLGENCRVGARSVVMSGAVLGAGVVLGAECVIHPNVTIYDGCVLGSRVIVHAGTVIGSDGFGFAREGGHHRKVPQIGNVVIHDDVEIGANVAIDRATLGSTVIERGVKIDNLVQIAHNVQIGENSLLVAQSGISGSTRLGRDVIMAGQSGAVGHIEIGDGARVGAKSAVTGDLRAGAFVIGHPAIEAGIWKRAAAIFARLPEFRRRIMKLEGAGEEPVAEAQSKDAPGSAREI